MNYQYPIPASQGNQNYFVADTTHQLGTLNKYIIASPILTVDYSQLTPAVTFAGNYSFHVSPGGMPGLGIGDSSLSGSLLTFQVGAGIGGNQYTITINIALSTGETRVDVLYVNVIDPNADTVCCPPTQGVGQLSTSMQTSGGGLTYVNTAPKWFVSSVEPTNANVLDEWYNPANPGYVYQYQTNGITSGWVIMGEVPTPIPPQPIPPNPVVPPTPVGAVPIIKMFPISPNGTAQTFNLYALDGTPVTIDSPNALLVFVDGVQQEPGGQYSTTNSQIIFSTPPAIDSRIWILWFSSGAEAMSTKVVKMMPITPDGVTTTFILEAIDSSTVNVLAVNTLFVSQDGVWQEPTVQFNAAGTQIVFAAAPTADSYIFIVWFAPGP
jgi:hypothetical protein